MKPEKKCKYCGTSENLHVDKNGNIWNICKNDLKHHYSLRTKKTIETNIKKYGVENISQVDDIKKKKESTCKSNYGVINPSLSEIVKEKRSNTMVKLYGVENIFQSEEIKERIKSQNLLKLGVDHHLKLVEYQNKQKNTNIKKYGVEYPGQIESGKISSKNTCMKKYGCEYPSQSDEIKNKIIITQRDDYWITFLLKMENLKFLPLFTKEDYIKNSIFKIKCLRCNKTFDTTETNPQKIHCGCLKYRSRYEDEIIDWLLKINNNIKIESNHRIYENNTMSEMDIFLPEYNIGIEFNGLYWHSDIFKSKLYHQNKYLFYKNKNIKLIQVFENEWLNSQNIVKSIISSKMNIFSESVFARKCKIQNINSSEYRKFLEENHIQGYSPAKIKLGLVYNNLIVSVIGIGSNRFKKGEMEVIRYCNKLNTKIIGGFSKLLSHIKSECNFDKLISYADLRYFDGSGYIKTGWTTDSITSPNYFYFKNGSGNTILYNRITFQKHKLKKLLNTFVESDSEYVKCGKYEGLKCLKFSSKKIILVLQNTMCIK